MAGIKPPPQKSTMRTVLTVSFTRPKSIERRRREEEAASMVSTALEAASTVSGIRQRPDAERVGRETEAWPLGTKAEPRDSTAAAVTARKEKRTMIAKEPLLNTVK